MAHIFVIAGHGAGDPGAVGNGYTEAERVRALAGRLAALGGANVTVGDTNRDWYADGGINTLNIPKDWQIVELHMDRAGTSARGGHVIIKSGYSPDKYDNAIAAFLKDILPGRSSHIVGRSDLANVNRAAARGYSYRLVECGFISNATDIGIFNSRMDDIARGFLKAFGVGVPSPAPAPKVPVQVPGNPVNNAGLYYSGHTQNAGDLPQVHDGQTCGTTGYAARLEALKIDVDRLRKTYGNNVVVNVKAHIQDTGWKEYKNINSSTLIGTTGKKQAIEALYIEITGLPQGKKFYFQTHVAGKGWTGWVANNFGSGTVGLKTAIEAVQMKIV